MGHRPIGKGRHHHEAQKFSLVSLSPFRSKLPRAISDAHLIEVLSGVGSLYEVRQMLEATGSNRGYCFAIYQSLDGAKRACSELNDLEIAPGRRIGVVRSVDNRRLFIGGIPREIKSDQILVSAS
ncbi:unnamed protein product [Anisakis simplex]|uniref:Dead end protein homolog 1 (inferred by orthology to a human protein) n=1 Tax=Anisakis simplex TaxID=6269 RepID=A0A0M3J014_ANISI|nr:unnamed protein product [Anisakis simplex]